MARDSEELERLERRIAGVQRCIEPARLHRGWAGNVAVRERMRTLLEATPRALEARKAALTSASP